MTFPMRPRLHPITAFFAFTLALVSTACGHTAPGARTSRTPTGDEALATLEGRTLMRSELTAEERVKLHEAELQLYKTKEAIAAQRYVAQKRADLEKSGSPREAAERELFKSKAVTDAEVSAFLSDKADNPSLAQMPEAQRKNVVRSYLEMEARQKAANAYVAAAQKSGAITMAAERPEQPRLEVPHGDNVVIGAKDARVTIVVFTDYQCPFCKRVEPTLKEALKKYEGKIKLVVRDFPLSFHPEAHPAALAATCAQNQGQFEAMKDGLFNHQESLSNDLYVRLARELKLDAAKFDACRKDPKTEWSVRQDIRDGETLGVNGTPALFINGRKAAGALNLDELSRLIDEELAAI